MIFRLLAIEAAADEAGERFRQVFVTASRTLVSRVQAYYNDLRSVTTQSAASVGDPLLGYSLEDLEDDTNASAPVQGFSHLKEQNFPLFVTYDRVSLFRSNPCVDGIDPIKLCQMLALDFGMEFLRTAPIAPLASKTNRHTTVPSKDRSKRYPLMSYDVFVSEIWPHYPEKTIKGFREQSHPEGENLLNPAFQIRRLSSASSWELSKGRKLL